MSSQSKAMRLRFVVTMCMVLAGGAVSMGTSCITAPKGKTAAGASTGTINGVVDSSNHSPIGAGLSGDRDRQRHWNASHRQYRSRRLVFAHGRAGWLGQDHGRPIRERERLLGTRRDELHHDQERDTDGRHPRAVSLALTLRGTEARPAVYREFRRGRNEPRNGENALSIGKSLAALCDENVMFRGRCARVGSRHHWR